jgi:RNA recognition motif-containing protein
MNTYVGYVSWDLTEEDSRHAFEGFGKDQLGTIIKDTGSGESRGSGFVEIPAKAEATSAIRGLSS